MSRINHLTNVLLHITLERVLAGGYSSASHR